MKKGKIQKFISASSILLILLHLFFPSLSIDIITVSLLALAIIPWLSPIFKKIELPGGISAEYQDLEKVTEKIEEAGLIKQGAQTTPDFLPNPSDSNLVMAWLRIEIEKRLRKIAKLNSLTNTQTMTTLLKDLNNKKLLSREEVSVLKDLKGTLNAAVHGHKVNKETVTWALKIGPQILAALDEKIT